MVIRGFFNALLSLTADTVTHPSFVNNHVRILSLCSLSHMLPIFNYKIARTTYI